MVRALYVFPDPDGLSDKILSYLELRVDGAVQSHVRSLICHPLRKQTLRFRDASGVNFATAELKVRLFEVPVKCSKAGKADVQTALGDVNVELKPDRLLGEARVPLHSILEVEVGSMSHQTVKLVPPEGAEEDLDEQISIAFVFMLKDEPAMTTPAAIEEQLEITKPQLYHIASAFNFCDLDGDQALSYEDISGACRILSRPLSAIQLRDLMTEMEVGEQQKASFSGFLKVFGSALRGMRSRILSTPELDSVRAAFTLCDVDGNGLIDVNELRAVLWKLGEAPTDEDLGKFMKRFDTNGDGAIDFAEFVRGFAALEPSTLEFKSFTIDKLAQVSHLLGEQRETDAVPMLTVRPKEENAVEELKRVYHVLDSKRSGHITAEDLCEAFRGLGIKCTDEYVKSLVEKMDADESRGIDLEEFLAGFAELDFSDAVLDKFAFEGFIALGDLMDIRFRKGARPVTCATTQEGRSALPPPMSEDEALIVQHQSAAKRQAAEQRVCLIM